MSSKQKGVVPIKGKDYKLIVQRVSEFRQAHPEFGVETEVLHHDEIRVVAQVRIFDEQGRPIITPQEVAGMSQDQLTAQQMARDLSGVQDRYLSEAEQAYKTGIGQLDAGQEAARGYGLRGLDATQTGVAEEKALRQSGLEGLLSSLGEGRDLARGATTDLYGRLGEAEGIRRGAAAGLGGRLGESEELLRGTTGGYDQSMTEQFLTIRRSRGSTNR